MATITITELFPDENPGEVFEAGKTTFRDLNIEIVKDRSFAFLLQGRLAGNNEINLNFIVNGFKKEMTLTLLSDTAGPDILQIEGEKFVKELKIKLN